MSKALILAMQVSLFLLLMLLQTSHAIWIYLPASGDKCVSEEMEDGVLVLADYVVIVPFEHSDQLPAVSVKVTSPHGNVLHRQENVATHGQFAFTTTEFGSYEACFSVSPAQGSYKGEGISVSIDWKTGIATKDWDSIAKKEKLEGVELELKKLEDAVNGIHDNIRYLKKREAKMRDASEKTNSKVAWFSITSLMICIGVSALQVWNLKTYFQKKRLI